mgnify:CR=1 FL=1
MKLTGNGECISDLTIYYNEFTYPYFENSRIKGIGYTSNLGKTGYVGFK